MKIGHKMKRISAGAISNYRTRLRKMSKGDIFVLGLVFIYALTFTLMTFSMYESYYYFDFDLAIFNQIMWNTLHDGFFLSSIISGGTFFGQQMTPILIFFLPLYAVFQSPLTLLFLQSFFLALAALPLYLLVKEELGERWGILFSVLYLIHPTVSNANLFEFHTNSFEIFFLLSFFYFYRKRNFSYSVLFALLSMFCKEDVFLVIFMFGIYGYVNKYDKRFVFFPLFLALSYFALTFFLIMPSLGGGVYFQFSDQYGRYSHLGGNFTEIIETLLTNPLYAMRYAFTEDKMEYIIRMFTFSGFLPLFSPEILLITIPPFAENLLSSASTQTNIAYQYQSSLTPFLMIASAFSIRRLRGWVSSRVDYRGFSVFFILLALTIGAASSIFYNPLIAISKRQDMFIPDKKDAARESMLELIPKDAPVMATFNFLPKLSGRKKLYSYHYWHMNETLNLSGISMEGGGVEYILLDFDDKYMNCCFKSAEGDIRQRELLKDPGWGIVALSENIILLKKNYKSPYTFVDVYKMRMSDEVGKANFMAALWLKENTDKNDVLYATTISSYVQYVSGISERQFLNYTSDSTISKELSTIELPEKFGGNVFVQTLEKYNVSYIYIFQKFGESEVVVWGTGKRTVFSKPKAIASRPNIFELVYENDFVRIYRINYPKAFKLCIS